MYIVHFCNPYRNTRWNNVAMHVSYTVKYKKTSINYNNEKKYRTQGRLLILAKFQQASHLPYIKNVYYPV